MSTSIWGDKVSEMLFFEGCKSVTCTGHGGIVVDENTFLNHKCFEKLAPHLDYFNEFYSNGAYYFEEDLESTIVLACLPSTFVKNVYYKNSSKSEVDIHESLMSSLMQNYPDVYTWMTGKELSIFESNKLLLEHVNNNNNKNAVYLNVIYHNSYNIPNGHVVISLTKGRFYEKNSIILGDYLVKLEDLNKYIPTKENYRNILPVFSDVSEINGLEHFNLDKSLPSKKPINPLPENYYFLKVKWFNGARLVLAYNYKSETKKCFLIDCSKGFDFIETGFNQQGVENGDYILTDHTEEDFSLVV